LTDQHFVIAEDRGAAFDVQGGDVASTVERHRPLRFADASASRARRRQISPCLIPPRIGLALGKWRALLKERGAFSWASRSDGWGRNLKPKPLVEVSGRTQREIAMDLGVSLSCSRRWLDKRREHEIEAPPPERQEDLAAELEAVAARE
jgi:hypothetical protein